MLQQLNATNKFINIFMPCQGGNPVIVSQKSHPRKTSKLARLGVCHQLLKNLDDMLNRLIFFNWFLDAREHLDVIHAKPFRV